jgi:hypothetical protein
MVKNNLAAGGSVCRARKDIGLSPLFFALNAPRPDRIQPQRVNLKQFSYTSLTLVPIKHTRMITHLFA